MRFSLLFLLILFTLQAKTWASDQKLKSLYKKLHLLCEKESDFFKVKGKWFPHASLGPGDRGAVSWRRDNGNFTLDYKFLRVKKRSVRVKPLEGGLGQVSLFEPRVEGRKVTLQGKVLTARRRSVSVDCRSCSHGKTLLCQHRYRGREHYFCYTRKRKEAGECRLTAGTLPKNVNAAN